MVAAASLIAADPALDAIAQQPLTDQAIVANVERSYDAIAGLPRGNLLLGYQQAALALIPEHELLVIEKSRRIGLTWALAADAVLTAAAPKSEGGDDVLYISYSQEMTREFISACAMWAKAFMSISAATGEFLFDDQTPDGETRQIKAFRISFASGKSIVALSSAPRSLRGKQGKVILDEAAFVDNLEALITAALALTIWGSKIIIVSTHNGADNPFNLLVESVKTGEQAGKWLRITFADALNDGLYERVMLVQGKPSSPEGKIAWEAKIRGIYVGRGDEELDCIPSAGKGAFIPAELIMEATRAEAGKPDLYTGKACGIGWDVARRAHLSVIAPFEQIGSVAVLREQIEMQDITFADQAKRFDAAMRRYKGTARVDQTGLGMAVVEAAQERNGVYAVQGVMFSSAVKLTLATLLKKRFEDRTIWIPDDPAVRADLRSIKQSGKGMGAPIFAADEPVAKKGDDGAPSPNRGHGDRFWAYALAILAIEEGLILIDFAAVDRDAGTAFSGDARTINENVGFGIVAAELGDMTGY
ncbi:hypothetical protein sos41_31410 [Alphaproteobacteria bacterium SO-S41]|nr:hypothetical protein sos41_31410 [Alphaproteobacteria bacterium SO-S41]